jgi:hypothetical protein
MVLDTTPILGNLHVKAFIYSKVPKRKQYEARPWTPLWFTTWTMRFCHLMWQKTRIQDTLKSTKSKQNCEPARHINTSLLCLTIAWNTWLVLTSQFSGLKGCFLVVTVAWLPMILQGSSLTFVGCLHPPIALIRIYVRLVPAELHALACTVTLHYRNSAWKNLRTTCS